MKLHKKRINEGLFGAAKEFSDAFFDGLKSNAVNRALETAKSNKKIPGKIIRQMADINKAARELQQMLKDFS